jgi:hypothetical protein
MTINQIQPHINSQLQRLQVTEIDEYDLSTELSAACGGGGGGGDAATEELEAKKNIPILPGSQSTYYSKLTTIYTYIHINIICICSNPAEGMDVCLL